MPRFPSLIPAILAAATLAAPALADRVPLAQQSAISDGLIAAAIAYEIGEQCDSLEARTLRGLVFLGSLRQEAQRLGYSSREIEQYMRDRAEKARLEALAWERFAALGGQRGDPASFCAVGRAQIAGQTQIGQLLR